MKDSILRIAKTFAGFVRAYEERSRVLVEAGNADRAARAEQAAEQTRALDRQARALERIAETLPKVGNMNRNNFR